MAIVETERHSHGTARHDGAPRWRLAVLVLIWFAVTLLFVTTRQHTNPARLDLRVPYDVPARTVG